VYCSNCGAQNDDNATHCANCGNELRRVETPHADMPPPQQPEAQISYPPPHAQVPVPNYLVPAILTTLFCCLPFGIASIVYAAQVNGKLEAGDRAGALESSRKAKMWAWISFGTGLVLIVVGVLVSVVFAALGSSGGA
jgi:Interferon-induced transmembrane protein/zinc-ribbon domain